MNAEQEMATADGLGADVDPLAELRAACSYSEEEDSSTDSLIEYKNALEDRCRQLEATQSHTVRARELGPGWQVKAPGAPAWSRIRAIGNVTPGKVEAFTEWGSLLYDAHEAVEAIPAP
jgi:hypothetical protein